jgi:RHS repeat-associated protein
MCSADGGGAADDGGLGWWAGQAAGGVMNRANVCNAFKASGEFQTLVANLYGTAASDNERTEHFVNNFYLGAYGRNATSTELQQQREALNTAAAQSQAAVQAQAETFGRGLFVGQVNDASLSNTQYVTNLYAAFLQRGPDAGGLSFWSGQASVGTGRQNVLNAFATCSAFRELSGTLYREANWLIADHLGTPRMIVNKSGSLASIKRHDYLPFGEELFAGIGGRTTTQGYTGDNVRQKFTSKERDIETGLDFFLARYYASTQGRFTGGDPANLKLRHLVNPQDLNRYAYVANNPLKFVDAAGEEKIQVVIETYIPTPATPSVAGNIFKGDGRPVPEVGESQDSGTFRTQQIITIETDPSKNGGNPLVAYSKDTGITYRSDAQGNEYGTPSQAKGDTLTTGATRNQDGSVEINAHGNEKDPKLPSWRTPGITYDYNVNVKDDGKGAITVTVSGSHDRYPAHVITASRIDQPKAKAITVYSFDPVKEKTTPWALEPPASNQKIKPTPVRLP